MGSSDFQSNRYLRKMRLRFPLVMLPAQLVSAARPETEYKHAEGHDFLAPDSSWRIEQYVNQHDEEPSRAWEWEIWVFPGRSEEGVRLTRRDENRLYPSYFVTSSDGKWLVRSQKIYSGTSTLYLYERDERSIFREATHRGLGDLAWSFVRMQPEIGFTEVPTFHKRVDAKWRDNRFLVLTLSADALYNVVTERNSLVSEWRCAFDLLNRKFLVLPEMVESNRQALIDRDIFYP